MKTNKEINEETDTKNLKSIMNHYVETASLSRALLCTIFFVIMMWLIDYSPIGVAGLLEVTGGANILDFECAYSVEYGYSMLEALGEAGRTFHLTKIMPLDIFFPLSLMLFTSGWISYFLKPLTKKNSIFRLLPLFSVLDMLLDWSENIGVTAMLLAYPKRLSVACRLTSLISTIKYACVLTVLIIFTGCLICFLFRKIMSFVAKSLQKEAI